MKPTHFLITVFISAVVAISSVFIWGRDNPVEEVAEAIIKVQTGLDIDFTPDE